MIMTHISSVSHFNWIVHFFVRVALREVSVLALHQFVEPVEEKRYMWLSMGPWNKTIVSLHKELTTQNK